MYVPAWDLEVLRLINDTWRGPGLDLVMPWLSETFMLVPVLGLVLGHLYYEGYKLRDLKLAKALGLCVLIGLLANLLTQLVKYAVGRSRPLYTFGDIWRYDSAAGAWLKNPAGYTPDASHPAVSFFSGHASTTMALAVALGLFFPPLRRWIWLMPLLCGYSRVYMGMHYPSDVLAGWAAGALIAWAVWRVRKERSLEEGKPKELAS